MSTTTPSPHGGVHEPPDELRPLPRVMRPFVDWVARRRATVHTKLLAGFLLIALLLLSMGMLSVAVLARIDNQVETLTALDEQTNRARQMIYEVTVQSHYRAMALITEEAQYTDKLYAAKDEFAATLAIARAESIPPRPGFFDRLEAANESFRVSSDQVTALYEAHHLQDALDLHVQQEHDISHTLEDSLNNLIADSQLLATGERESFATHRTFLTIAVAAFSGVSLLAALTLGAVLSWSLIRPVRRVDGALERLAGGDFDTRVDVPNRDEFGNLTRNLKRHQRASVDAVPRPGVAELEPPGGGRRQGRRARASAPAQAVPVAAAGRVDRGGGARRHAGPEPEVPHDVLLRRAGVHVCVGADGAGGADRRAERLPLGDDGDRIPPRWHARQVRRRCGDGVLRRSDPAARSRRARRADGVRDAGPDDEPAGPLGSAATTRRSRSASASRRAG